MAFENPWLFAALSGLLFSFVAVRLALRDERRRRRARTGFRTLRP